MGPAPNERGPSLVRILVGRSRRASTAVRRSSLKTCRSCSWTSGRSAQHAAPNLADDLDLVQVPATDRGGLKPKGRPGCRWPSWWPGRSRDAAPPHTDTAPPRGPQLCQLGIGAVPHGFPFVLPGLGVRADGSPAGGSRGCARARRTQPDRKGVCEERLGRPSAGPYLNGRVKTGHLWAPQNRPV